MKGFRSRVTSFLLGTREEKPVIKSQYGITDEGMRFQAAMNMLADPAVRMRVEEHLIKMLGSRERGLAEARRRYPEAYK